MLSVSRKVGKSGGFQFGLTTCIKQSQLTDSPGYIECDNFWLIKGLWKDTMCNARHEHDRPRVNTLQRTWRPFYLQHQLTSKNNIYNSPSPTYSNVCPVHSLLPIIARLPRAAAACFRRKYFQSSRDSLRLRGAAVTKNWY